ncbi:MAG TPA: hypothetical protein VMU43_13265 [Candidatus Acidoferrum sp.]|nr:hypothetical protein [Candidatus Acidoferrum sp.]
MNWFAQRVAAYEKMRFDQEPNRTRLPFTWGLEHIGGPAEAQAQVAREFLEKYVSEAMAHSDEWYFSGKAEDYLLDGKNVLTFTSAVRSQWPENNRVYAQYFPAAKGSPAVVVLAQWNSRWEEQQAVCRYLNFLGLAAIKLSLPYHDHRAVPGHPRADHLVGPNVGLTLQANRQAVLDVRRTLRWLEAQGHTRLGILGTSIGSCLAFLTLAHEPALQAGAFLHVSTYFADVVARGLTTSNVWESLAPQLSLEELRRFWSPISPYPFIPKLYGTSRRVLAITARYDPTFPFDLTTEFLNAVGRDGIVPETLTLPCGHYSLGVAPFKYAVGYRFGRFLKKALG